jgi:succinoglycan biosynthesis protein ExoM
MHISVCICTFRRPMMLKRLLKELVLQDTSGLFTFSVVITDNDALESAKQLVNDFMVESDIEIIYCVEPRKNISHARNMGLGYARGDAIAFIDDDEFPSPNWLLHMYRALIAYQSAGVLGPVKPFFDSAPPAWLIKGGFYNRPAHRTGFVLPWWECRTGNVLINRRTIEKLHTVFRPEFGAGAEDQDLFLRLIEMGHEFIWCNEARVFELVPPHRWKRAFLIRAALLRGNLNLLRPDRNLYPIMTSMLAVPLYGLSLPFLQILGHHYFMNYLVKLCDHAGRLLALMGLNPIRTRKT